MEAVLKVTSCLYYHYYSGPAFRIEVFSSSELSVYQGRIQVPGDDYHQQEKDLQCISHPYLN